MNIFGLSILIGGITTTIGSYMKDYTNYIEKYNRDFSYDNYEIFKINMKEIEKINNDEKYTFKVGVNGFVDTMGGMKEIIIDEPDEYYIPDEIKIPQKMDWRNEGVVTDVKNQGHCGSCWAFSTTGSIEGIIGIKENNLYNISEQQLVDCSVKNHGCEGGSMDYAYQYVINNGLCSEKEYPYEGVDDLCRMDQCKSVVNVTDYKNIYPNEMIMKRVVSQQPVSVAIQANLTTFRLYSGGIYNDENCGDQLDHGVLVVGYGTENGNDYWIVKNSWGEDWGERGYIRIQRNSGKEYGI